MVRAWSLGLSLSLLPISAALAYQSGPASHYDYEQAPPCLDQQGNELDVNNDQIVEWKETTQTGYLNRGHVSGTVFAVYPSQPTHAHFGILLDGEPQSSGSLEVVYDTLFGSIPQVNVGDQIEACGDFINSAGQNGQYAPSPDGAIIHWIHATDTPKHESGFLIINGTVYGQELPNN